MPDRTDFGLIQQITVRPDPEDKAFYNLIIAPLEGQKLLVRASHESLRSLWSYLTKILYPRASDQLTKRIETVKREKEDVPPGITYTITAYTGETDPSIVTISGSSREQYWTLQIAQSAAEDLWTVLEDKLDQV